MQLAWAQFLLQNPAMPINESHYEIIACPFAENPSAECLQAMKESVYVCRTPSSWGRDYHSCRLYCKKSGVYPVSFARS